MAIQEQSGIRTKIEPEFFLRWRGISRKVSFHFQQICDDLNMDVRRPSSVFLTCADAAEAFSLANGLSLA